MLDGIAGALAVFEAQDSRHVLLPTAWYLNDTANLDFAARAKNFGRVSTPALFVHAEYDPVDETIRSRLAEPMRLDCTNLTEVKLPNGHFIMLERKVDLSEAIQRWLAAKIEQE